MIVDPSPLSNPATPPAPDAANAQAAAPDSATFRLHATEIWSALAIVVVDQLTKAALRARLPVHDSIDVVPGFFSLTHVRNTGAAFGLLNTVEFPFKSAVLALVATCALIGIGVYAARLSVHERTARFGLSLVLGGAVGNLIDRLTLGSVVDFVDLYWREFHFWAFNVADASITIGVVVLMLDMMGCCRHVSKTS
jgi:signal peptidase II